MVDWSSTVAWIALVISLVGSILSPIINTKMAQSFQLKLKKIEAREKEAEEHYLKKREAIISFIAYVDAFIIGQDRETLSNCGAKFAPIYIYTPKTLWNKIDKIHELIISRDPEEAASIFIDLVKSLSIILEEADRQYR